MRRILVTGGRGFLGRNLIAHLRERKDLEVATFGHGDSMQEFRLMLREADCIFHLAGVNRPEDPVEFEQVNTHLTEEMCRILLGEGRSPKIIFSSSIQAELENCYGKSKARAESALLHYTSQSGACLRIYRLKNIFGKWCRPNYNSVIATFCHNIANELPIIVSDPARTVELSYIDDVVAAFLNEVDEKQKQTEPGKGLPSYTIQLGDLASRIQTFHEMGKTLMVPDFSDWFNRALYACYLSYLPPDDLRKTLEIKSDPRGTLAEFIKEKHCGQIFISRTNPGITRGNHYHHTKTEKFFVVEGEGLIRMRSIEGGPIMEFRVKGSEYQVLEIPPGITHSITNVGAGEMVTLFWSSEIFDPDRPDTYYLPVDFCEQSEQPATERA